MGFEVLFFVGFFYWLAFGMYYQDVSGAFDNPGSVFLARAFKGFSGGSSASLPGMS